MRSFGFALAENSSRLSPERKVVRPERNLRWVDELVRTVRWWDLGLILEIEVERGEELEMESVGEQDISVIRLA